MRWRPVTPPPAGSTAAPARGAILSAGAVAALAAGGALAAPTGLSVGG